LRLLNDDNEVEGRGSVSAGDQDLEMVFPAERAQEVLCDASYGVSKWCVYPPWR